MSNPSNDATKDATNDATNKPDFVKQVNLAVKQVKRDENTNKLVYPEEMGEELKYAVAAEIRRRDTQTGYTKASQQSKVLQEENKLLRERLLKSTSISLTSEQKEELETLKYENPEKWRTKINELERLAQSSLTKEFDTAVAEANKASEIEIRKDQLAAFIEDHPDFVINDDVITNDVPPRITKKLEDGIIDFPAFLGEVEAYLASGKVVVGSDADNTPDLGTVGGGSTASKTAIAGDVETSYKDELY